MNSKLTICIIGAGMAGLTLAQRLSPYASVVIFDKARGVGGRLATRYHNSYVFDHGAQFVASHSDRFTRFCTSLCQQGVLSPWQARFVEIRDGEVGQLRYWQDDNPHFVGVGKMNNMAKHLAQGLDIRLSTLVTQSYKHNGQWRLQTNNDQVDMKFDWLIMALPPKQAAACLPNNISFFDALYDYTMKPCFSLMLGSIEPLPLCWDAAIIKGHKISWCANNQSKPSRHHLPSYTIHSTNDWAQYHLEADTQWVTDQLLYEAKMVLDIKKDNFTHIDLHRWRYANISQQKGPAYLLDLEYKTAACGDWCVRGRVEAAFSSANALADNMLTVLQDQ